MTEFFLVALPGLEEIVKREVLDWYPDLEPKIEHGGVTVHAPLERGLEMNLALKTVTRILLRVSTFRCRDFPKLYNYIRTTKWEEWVDPACVIDVNVATRLSRLKIKSRIEEACLDGWAAHAEEAGVKPDHRKKLTLYVRFVNDECTLSLDTSGERLHKRGARELVGEAPLRETIAAALIALTASTDEAADVVEVVDPMTGSGTFLLEAGTRDEVVASREFAFANFRAQPTRPPELRAAHAKVEGLIGFEADAKTLKAARGNLGKTADLRHQDIFAAEPLPAARRRWLFCNPPYGERLKVDEPLVKLYERLFAACENVARPDRACFLLPAKGVKGKFLLPPAWKVLAKQPFVNGGIPVVAFVFGRHGQSEPASVGQPMRTQRSTN